MLLTSLSSGPQGDTGFLARLALGDADECWPWTGYCDPGRGYGRVKRNGETLWAHRYAFKLAHGRDPVGVVRHSCDNPPCCNPAHLLEGTYLDNMQDAKSRGRLARGERIAGAFLTQQIADEIRRLYSVGDVSQVELAKRFGTKQPN